MAGRFRYRARNARVEALRSIIRQTFWNFMRWSLPQGLTVCNRRAALAEALGT
jgi:hypothetical protein